MTVTLNGLIGGRGQLMYFQTFGHENVIKHENRVTPPPPYFLTTPNTPLKRN